MAGTAFCPMLLRPLFGKDVLVRIILWTTHPNLLIVTGYSLVTTTMYLLSKVFLQVVDRITFGHLK